MSACDLFLRNVYPADDKDQRERTRQMGVIVKEFKAMMEEDNSAKLSECHEKVAALMNTEPNLLTDTAAYAKQLLF
jgi:hypothetical protein